MKKYFLPAFAVFIWCTACVTKKKDNNIISADSTANVFDFKGDVDFLKKYTDVIVLKDGSGKNKIAISPALQGRVMTSTSAGENGLSYGWINRAAFLSGDTSDHINVFGGEDRFWLGPEGGQFSIYFSKGSDFNLENWHVPRLIDLEPFDVASSSQTEAVFTKQAELINYSQTKFNIGIERKVRLLSKDEAIQLLGAKDENVSVVAYETINTLKNTGKDPWRKDTGLLSIWILGMFNPSDSTTIVVPYQGSKGGLREIVNDNYFGKVPDDRLKHDKVVYFRGDGKYRSKIGFSATRATPWLGSYDAMNGVLTIVKYNKPEGQTDYVNSSWEIQEYPYQGDVVNSYNDGPPSPGAKPLGPFYELETSSPAAELKPGSSITHTHTTFHVQGNPEQLDPIAQKIFGVTLTDIVKAFSADNK